MDMNHYVIEQLMLQRKQQIEAEAKVAWQWEGVETLKKAYFHHKLVSFIRPNKLQPTPCC